MYAHGEACRPEKDRADFGAYCPNRSMVREPYDCIIGEAPIGAIPLGRVATVRGSLRRHAYTAMVEAMMSRRQSSAKPAGLSQLNLNAAGIDVGATSHYVAVPAGQEEPPVREFEGFHGGPVPFGGLAWQSVVWRPWSWSPPACTGYRCSGCWKNGASR